MKVAHRRHREVLALEAVVVALSGLETLLHSHQVDYEGELAVVIGRTCKNVSQDEALACVLGYTCANDVSARYIGRLR